MIVIAPEIPAVVQADPQALYQAAVTDRQAGRPADAVVKLEQVLLARPDDVDARLNLGLALLALGRLDEAESAFSMVIARAPDYADAHAGLARIAQRRGDLSTAQREAAEAARLAPNDLEMTALARSVAGAPQWRIDVSGARSALSEGLPDWLEARFGVSRALAGQWNVGLAVEATERFDDRDTYVEGRIDRRLGRGGVYVAVGGAVDADYRPEALLGFGGQWQLTGRIAGTLDGAAARYRSGSVTTVQPGVLVDIMPERLQVSARWIHVRDELGEPRNGYALQSRWQAADRVALRLGYADAPETSEGVTVDVVAWNAGLDLELTERLTLRVTGVAEDRDAYDRREASVGLGIRF